MIHEHDPVALIKDRPDSHLRKGDVGTVVHVHKQGEAFEVEFIDPKLKTIGVFTMPSAQLIRLNVLPLSA